MDLQSVLLYGAAALALLLISVSRRCAQFSAIVYDENPFILVLRALGHLSGCAPQ